MATLTTNFNLSKPAVNSATDEDLWGDLLNANMDTIDTTLKQARDMLTLAKTAAYTVVAADRNKMITCDTSGGAFTVDLLDAATAGDGFMLSIKKIDSSANAVTIDGDTTETIDGSLTKALSSQYETLVLKCDGSDWLIVSQPASAVPTGTVIDFAGTSAPSGFLGCDGSAVSRSTYADLFAVIGVTWGVGDGSTTFNIPDLERATTIGSGGTGTATIGNSVGDTGGTETHTLTTDEIPLHGHPWRHSAGTQGDVVDGGLMGDGDGAQTSYPAYTGAVSSTDGEQIGGTGGGAAHNIMQPSAVMLKVIKT